MKNLKTAIKHFINGPFNDKWQDKERFLNCFLAEKRALIDFIYVKKEKMKKVLPASRNIKITDGLLGRLYQTFGEKNVKAVEKYIENTGKMH